MLKRSLHTRILVLIIGIIGIVVAISIFWGALRERDVHIEETLKANERISEPILKAIYVDMLAERADMARTLIKAIGRSGGADNIYIIRSNGVEEAFNDLKTVNEVKGRIGYARPEWLHEHPDVKDNTAEDAGDPDFKQAFAALKSDWQSDATHYIEYESGDPVLVYLQPIYKKPDCNRCHGAEGGGGALVIKTSLAGIYSEMDKARGKMILSGLIGIAISGVLLSILVRRSITGPIQRNVDVIKKIADGKAGMSERLEVRSHNEIGYLSTAFNNMLDTIEKRAEENNKLFEMVAKSRQEWVATFDAIQDLIAIHDKENRVLKVNRALSRKFNAEPEDLIGKRCKDIFYNRNEPGKTCPHSDTLITAAVAAVEADDLAFEGTYKITTFPVFNAAGEVWACVHIARDITQEKLLREQLLHVEKLSSVGKLVAGIAHELNNPLMGIMGFSQILMDLPGDRKLEDIKEKLRKIYHESLRTAKIVQNLLTFARAKKTERDFHNINELIRHTLEMRDYSLRSNNIQAALDLDPELPGTMVDPFQLQQVFINIINNAEDAMVASRGRGTLRIRTRKQRGKIEITFKDDGPGIPREIVNKVFDPFFTTKEVGKGTGLGLSITHGIVTEHGGAIDISCPDEGGTAVTIELPVVNKAQWMEVKGIVETGGKTWNFTAGKKVLIVDDEKSIRETLRDILMREGFAVETARDGREALDMLDRDKYSLIITDIKMPGIGGLDLYDSVLKKYNYLKNRIIVLTGDVFSENIKEFFSRTNCPYILKPFEPRELLALIRQVIS